MTPGRVSVFNIPWFDSGYKFGVSLRLLENFYFFYVKGTRRSTPGSHLNIFSDVREHSVRMDVSPGRVSEGSGWRGRREFAPRCSDTQLGA